MTFPMTRPPRPQSTHSSCHDHEDHVLPLWRLRGLRLGKDRMSAPDLTQMMIELSELAHILPTLHYHRSLHEAGFYAAIMTIVFNTESSYPEVNYSLNILYNEIPIIWINYVVHFYKLSLEWRASREKSNLLIPAVTFEPFLKLGPKKFYHAGAGWAWMAVIGR